MVGDCRQEPTKDSDHVWPGSYGFRDQLRHVWTSRTHGQIIRIDRPQKKTRSPHLQERSGKAKGSESLDCDTIDYFRFRERRMIPVVRNIGAILREHGYLMTSTGQPFRKLLDVGLPPTYDGIIIWCYMHYPHDESLPLAGMTRFPPKSFL